MAVTISSSPPALCFIDDGIQYILTRDRIDNTNKPMKLRFTVGVPTGASTSNDAIELLYIPDINPYDSTQDIFHVDITDVVSGFISRLNTNNSGIIGYAILKLSKIDDESVNIDVNHYCFPGTSGGLDIFTDIDAATHPFFTARGNEQGALHFFRSELRAIKHLYAFIPGTANSFRFDTDNKEWESYVPLQSLVKTAQSRIASIWMSAGSSGYDIISTSNAVYVSIGIFDSGFEVQHTYAIAIEDDPESDETHLIRWINSMGVQDAILLTGELKDVSEVENPELYINDQTVHDVSRGIIRSRMTTTKYELETGYLSPARILALRDMLCSMDVEFLNDGVWTPVSVTAKTKHAVQQREPESFKLTIEVLEQTRYPKPNRTVVPIPEQRANLLQDNYGSVITDNNSNTIY